MENEVLVKVEGLSKKFCKDLRTSLWYGVKDLFSNLSGNKNERLLRDKEFWALKDINFEVRRGECFGLIGHNGAGKSSLLKILNGLIKPDAGKVTIKGKVGALIELGAGFNPVLTGRENIYNNGAILGFTRKEIDDKVEEIIDFAEIREFIDMPVKNYSSGMKVRLGFAVAAQMQPDVLIIDEVLAVGDLGFVLKCFKTIDNILPNTAVIFVSHSMPMISRLCSKIILMERGKAVFQGEDVAGAIDKYYGHFANNEMDEVFSDGQFRLEQINLVSPNDSNSLKWGEDLKLYLNFNHNSIKEVPEIFVIISDKEQRPVAILEKNNGDDGISFKENQMEFMVTHKNIQLSKGVYSISVALRSLDNKEPKLRVNSALSFQVIHQDEIWEPFLLKSQFEKIETRISKNKLLDDSGY
ncbi:ABC transporter ATP-binding protein [Salinimicrobium sp. HB62]|uniref:ABC transporter ATP-binding protein n=1 Tax=Salinimicrobium sp. HB62 TaxID=3077781 RepID=UPI002D7806B1|nr:ABC transporter ATP-binding protein [Salinimicrobium sp. HB62]